MVGPNGCGKSNLVEALRFVMGESSYKAMRGGGMEDVIFSGSGNRPSRNMAEVTLVAERSGDTPRNAETLEITRRIEREAGSTYRINGRETRARDVQIIFADAATGSRSSAFVRQGQIGELIAMKPIQRRGILEDAAGISGLHARRDEAEQKLKGAEQNLERLHDVVSEISGRLEGLKRQARQAVRYRKLSGEIRKAEAILSALHWEAAEARLAEAEVELTEAREAFDLRLRGPGFRGPAGGRGVRKPSSAPQAGSGRCGGSRTPASGGRGHRPRGGAAQGASRGADDPPRAELG